jgi:hypothetical protein
MKVRSGLPAHVCIALTNAIAALVTAIELKP